jgi:sulfatase modifying factor 1
MIGSLPNQANYYDGAFAVFPKESENQNYLTDVGAFTNSSSYYGTFDQDANAYEWTDGAGVAAAEIALRGGYWTSNQADLSSLDRYVTVPGYEFNGNGFRLASPSANTP